MNIEGGLITGGLGLPAAGGMITMKFHLFESGVVPPTPSDGSGGSHAYKPGQMQNFYQPVDQPRVPLQTYSEPEYLVPVNREFRPTKHFKFVVTIGEKIYEKDIVLPIITRTIAFKSVDLVNATIDRVNAVASNLKKITTRAKAIVTSFRRKP